MDADHLAESLAERMREVVPSEIEVRADKDMLWFALGKNSPPICGSYACPVLDIEGEAGDRLLVLASTETR